MAINKKTKPTISDPQLRAEYIKLFEGGITGNTNTYEQVRTRFRLAKERHVKVYRSALSDWKEAKQTATNDAIYQNQREALKGGLKSRIEWVLELQKELAENRVEESFLDIKTGKVIRYFRAMTPTERKGYIERIAKFEGMDAPNKVAPVKPDGTPLTQPITTVIINGIEPSKD